MSTKVESRIKQYEKSIKQLKATGDYFTIENKGLLRAVLFMAAQNVGIPIKTAVGNGGKLCVFRKDLKD